MEALLRGLLYLGCFLLIGGGWFARWVGPELARTYPGPLRYLLQIGAGSVVLSSLGIAAATAGSLGESPLALFRETQLGSILLVRFAVAFFLLGLGLEGRKWFHNLLVVILLLTLSLTAHAGAEGGALWVVDLLHLLATSLWGGSLLCLTLLWTAEKPFPCTMAVRRLSVLGSWAVALFSLSGIYLGFALHALPGALSSDYSTILWVKVTLVGVLLAVASFNRWFLLPLLGLGPSVQVLKKLGHALRLEALLLIPSCAT